MTNIKPLTDEEIAKEIAFVKDYERGLGYHGKMLLRAFENIRLLKAMLSDKRDEISDLKSEIDQYQRSL